MPSERKCVHRLISFHVTFHLKLSLLQWFQKGELLPQQLIFIRSGSVQAIQNIVFVSDIDIHIPALFHFVVNLATIFGLFLMFQPESKPLGLYIKKKNTNNRFECFSLCETSFFFALDKTEPSALHQKDLETVLNCCLQPKPCISFKVRFFYWIEFDQG